MASTSDSASVPFCPREPDIQCFPGPRNGLCCKFTPIDEPVGFSIYRRNAGHWDVNGQGGRLFRIRGERGNVLVIDERDNDKLPRHPREWQKFRTVSAAVTWIADELMRDDLEQPRP